MRAAAIFGLGSSPNDLKPFRIAEAIDWVIGMPSSSDQADAILLFGGDGTIHRHLSPLVKLDLPVLIVPVGSGNDFARALGLRGVRDSIKAWQHFCAGQNNTRAIDLGVITPLEVDAIEGALSKSVPGTQHYFASVAGIGLDADVSRRASSLPPWLRGNGGYALTLLPTIFRFAPFRIKILTAAEPNTWVARSDQRTTLAAFANTSTYGGGMKIAPRAQVDDGQLDCCVIGSMAPFKLACMFPSVYFGRHLSLREVLYFQAANLGVQTETPCDIYADGEYICHTPAEVSLQPAALRVLTP